MRTFSITLLLFSLLCLAGWYQYKPADSPSGQLPLVSLTAFEVNAPDSRAGLALARAARGWEGVTAAAWNETSGLLVLSHTLDQEVTRLQDKIRLLTSKPVAIKTFPEKAGAQCPVPTSAIAALPTALLGCGIGSMLLGLLLFRSGGRHKHESFNQSSHQNL
ncbi:MAG: hypothetical protein IT261_04210 [Saprospiraceae bacterium]|nr:hypothetical protein [Saprospiraceae bacterium]